MNRKTSYNEARNVLLWSGTYHSMECDRSGCGRKGGGRKGEGKRQGKERILQAVGCQKQAIWAKNSIFLAKFRQKIKKHLHNCRIFRNFVVAIYLEYACTRVHARIAKSRQQKYNKQGHRSFGDNENNKKAKNK